MNTENNRRGACDRCRGQKLRCVGLARPVPNPGCRFQRNEVPCERCKRAKVECYSVRPTPRRAASDRHPNRGLAPPRSTMNGPEGPSNDESLQHLNSTRSTNDEQKIQHAEDTDPSSTLPATPSEWMTYSPVEDMSWNDLDLEPPVWTMDPDLHLRQESILDSLGDDGIIDPATKAMSVDWNPDQLELDVGPGRTSSTHEASSSTDQEHSSMDHRTNNTRQTKSPSQRLGPCLETTKLCTQELTKLNEMLLREKSNLEDASRHNGRLSIGQLLHHGQEFLSILQRLRWSCTNKSESNGSRTESEWSSSEDATENNCSPGFSSSSSKSPWTSLTPTPAPPLEVPTLLSILSCYAYILQSYDRLLTPILDAVTRSAPAVPATLTGLRLDGFELDGHHTLQLECWTSVSFNMLEKMENILIGTPRLGGLFSQARGGLLRDKLSAGLLDTLYDQNEQNAIAHGNGRREVRAKRLIREIQATLKLVDLEQ